MSLKIRLARGGAKKRPLLFIVVADSRYPRDGRFIEKLGTFDPCCRRTTAERVKFDPEKAKEWLAKGAQPTDRVARFLDAAGLAEARAAQQPREGPSRRRRPRSAPPRPPRPPRRPSLPRTGRGPEPDRVRGARPSYVSASGVLGAPHGVRGEIELKSFTEDPAAVVDYGP